MARKMLEWKRQLKAVMDNPDYIELQMDATVRELLEGKYDEERIDLIINDLVTGKYTHDFPITAEGVCELLGQCAQTELPKEVYQLMDFYKMGKPQRSGIEYVPLNRPAQA